MAKETKELIAAKASAKLIMDVGTAIVDAVIANKGNIGHLQRLIESNDPEWLKEIGERVMRMRLVTMAARAVYAMPLFASLQTQFNWTDPAFNKLDFAPIEQCRQAEVEERDMDFVYVHLDRDASTEEVLAEMEALGLRPATYMELLAFARAYPDEQRKFPIVALGSVAVLDGGQHVACLGRGDADRGLYLFWFAGAWFGYFRFLAVRK